MCKAWLRKKSQPKWVVPTLSTRTNDRCTHEGWLFEPKWDGERHPCGAVAAIIIANAMTLPRAARNEGTLVLKKFGDAQQVPKPSAPEPCVPPGNVPPLPLPDIPVPDPAPPPLENPGDVPLPPVTDPDVFEPGEPNPTHPPMRARGAKKVAASQEKSSQGVPQTRNTPSPGRLAQPRPQHWSHRSHRARPQRIRQDAPSRRRDCQKSP